MKKMKKWQRILLWVLVALMVLPSLISLALLAFATDVDDIQRELDEAIAKQESIEAMLSEIETSQGDLDEKMKAAQEELAALQADSASVFDQKASIDQQINILSERIALIDEATITLQADIEKNRAELAQVTEQLDKTYETFKTRLRVTYESDKSSYLSVLLSSESMTDFFSKLTMVKQILQNDKDIMRDLENLKKTVTVKNESLTKELEANQTLCDELNSKKNELTMTYDSSLDILSELGSEETASADLLKAYELLWAQASAEEEQMIKDYIAASEAVEQKQSEYSSAVYASEQEASRSLAASIEQSRYVASSIERSRYVASSVSRSIYESSSIAARTTATTPKTTIATTEPITEPPSTYGDYIWPTPGYYTITSYFGGRYHPVTGEWNTHSGVDIGAYYGTDVLAIASGTVIESGYSYYFGNCIRIDHGNGCISLYGHFKQPANYKVGDYVSQGAVLGYVGSTGLSTGAHLHITTYMNGVLVDPLTILP